MNKLLLKAGFTALAGLVILIPVSLTAEDGIFNSNLQNSTKLTLVAPVNLAAPGLLAAKQLKKVHLVSKEPKALTAHKPAYLCRFSGIATLNGELVKNAQISIWITSPRIEETRTLKTGPDGAYTANFAMDGVINEPVDWEIRGLTVDMKTFKASGRRILMQDEHLITVEQPVEFLAD